MKKESEKEAKKKEMEDKKKEKQEEKEEKRRTKKKVRVLRKEVGAKDTLNRQSAVLRYNLGGFYVFLKACSKMKRRRPWKEPHCAKRKKKGKRGGRKRGRR